jgi:predicted DNA-binding WGR domain protein
MYAHLECVDPSENCLRFYKLSAFENMFGDWQLDREWGRIGRQGTIGSTLHGDRLETALCAHGILALKVRGGYQVTEIDWGPSNVIGLIPRREGAIFNLKLCAFFVGRPKLQSMALRMYSNDILYVGELVQLQHEVVAQFFGSRKGTTAAFFDGVSDQHRELIESLAECNLQLAANVRGWKRPDFERSPYKLVNERFRS